MALQAAKQQRPGFAQALEESPHAVVEDLRLVLLHQVLMNPHDRQALLGLRQDHLAPRLAFATPASGEGSCGLAGTSFGRGRLRQGRVGRRMGWS